MIDYSKAQQNDLTSLGIAQYASERLSTALAAAKRDRRDLRRKSQSPPRSRSPHRDQRRSDLPTSFASPLEGQLREAKEKASQQGQPLLTLPDPPLL